MARVWILIILVQHLFNLNSNPKFLFKTSLTCSFNHQNLLSIAKFAADNKVYFEFFPNHCYVKDQASSKVLMACKLKDGLFVFDPPQFLSNSSSKIHTDYSSMNSTTNQQRSLVVMFLLVLLLFLLSKISNSCLMFSPRGIIDQDTQLP